ncbi:bifunctional diguanylate cyclase/phosphodiesterase [Marinobacter apostichopi]|uniref:bifunctional diguanylate cyclase/phosphodiesterase n=1 Tax=Marinobacter apostichopi TaxID=3035454 RepID=UPI002574801F|nr:EAL domain-containing protein [Marinobacter sp. LA51]
MSSNYPEDLRFGEAALRNLEPQERERDGAALIRSLGNGLIASVVGVLLCVAAIVIVVFFAANRLDDYAGEKSLEKTQRLLDVEVRRLADLCLEYGWWNEAVDMVIYKRDLEWSETYVGVYLQERYGLEAIISLGADGELVYGRYGDEVLQQDRPGELKSANLDTLIQAAVDTDFNDPVPAVGFVDVGGTPAIAAVTTYAVYEPTEFNVNESHGSLILIKLLDQELLSAWSDDFHITGLTFSPKKSGADNEHSIALSGPGEQVLGHLEWSPERPGQQFLALVLPWAGGAGLLMTLACLFFYTKLRTYGRIAHAHFEELVSSREVLYQQAQFDFLTGLVNRPLFLELVSREMNRCFRHKEKAAVVYIDLDGFKAVNDSLGHDVGDELLCLVSEELSNSVRGEDVVARFGGDEFCLLLTGITDASDIERVLGKIQSQFLRPVSLGSHRVVIGVSAGIVIIPDDTADCSTVFRYADMAMYAAKKHGQNGYRFYSEEMETHSRQRNALKSQLLTSLANQELYLVYQPVYDLRDRSVRGLEALLRWRSAELGDVSPSDFIPVAEESGAIEHIGLWVAGKVLEDLTEMDQRTGQKLTVSINVSVKQLRDPKFPDRLDELLRKYDHDSSRLKLEITESLLITEQDSEHTVLMELSSRGYRLVLDDFGTGYSALGYLQLYPLETIKIDKSFVSGGSASGSHMPLVKSIVYMAQTMGMTTVAEGIETEEQEAFVAALGCTFGQGFLFSRPERLERILEIIERADDDQTSP